MAMTFMPLKRAQYHWKQRNVIDKIQIVTAPKDDPDKIQPLIADILHTVSITATRGDETVKTEVHLTGKAAGSANTSDEVLTGDALLGVECEDVDDNGVKLTKIVPGG